MSAQPLGATFPANVRASLLESLISAASYLHSGNGVRDFCTIVFGRAETEAAIEEQKRLEREEMSNGWHKESDALRPLAKAWHTLCEEGEMENADALGEAALRHFSKQQRDDEVSELVNQPFAMEQEVDDE